MKKSVFFVLLAFVFIVLINNSAAYAQNCDDFVIDEAGIFGREMARVESAARKLQNIGAEPRIRTFNSGRNLDIIQKQLENNCLSWQSADGGRKNNLIVLMISVKDRQFGFYAGEQWRNALEAQYIRIENDFMVPRFRDGDFAGGFIAGIDQMTKIIEAKVNSPAPGLPPTVIIEKQVVPSKPVDLSGLWSVLGWLIGLSAAAGLGFLLWQLKLKSERRRAAQQKAIVRKQAASARVNELNTATSELESSLENLQKHVCENDLKPLKLSLSKTKSLVENATIKYSDANKSAGDPSRQGLSKAEYESAERSFDDVINSLEEARQSLKGSETSLHDLQQFITDTPKLLQEAETAVSNASANIENAQKNGFKTISLDSSLNEAGEFLKKAKESLEKKDFNTAARFGTNSKNLSLAVAKTASGLREKKQTLDENISHLNSQLEQIVKAVASGKSAFERISFKYSPSSWQSIRGNGTETEERIEWTRNALKEAGSLSSMENQKWDETEKLISEINERLAEADSFMRSIIALEKNLIAAEKDAPTEIDAAKSDIEKAWGYVKRHDDDIPESYEDALREAESVLQKARSELAQHQPDYLQVVKLAKTANDSADSILDKSRSDYETAERLRQKAASLTRGANAAYSKAKEYIEDHSGDVEGSAKESLRLADVCLGDLKHGGISTKKQIEAAEQAEKYAKEAYSKAKRGVDRAEEEKARRRRAAAARAMSSSSFGVNIGSSSGRSGSGGGGFGGSRSFGSSGRGFGGSRGW